VLVSVKALNVELASWAVADTRAVLVVTSVVLMLLLLALVTAEVVVTAVVVCALVLETFTRSSITDALRTS